MYCENSPVVLFDPTGCSPANVIGAVVGGIGGAVIGTALVKHFHLTGWKKWLVLGSITGLMAIVGWFAGPAIYAALKPIVIKAITACTLAVGAIKEWAFKALGIAQRCINQALRLIPQDKLRFRKIDEHYEWVGEVKDGQTVHRAIGIDICESDVWGNGIGTNALRAFINCFLKTERTSFIRKLGRAMYV